MFKQLVDKQFPRLTAHLDSLGVNVASVSTQWFLCVFVNSLPLETCLRVWDLFLFERCSSVLFRVALALVDIYAQARGPRLQPVPSPVCEWCSPHGCRRGPSGTPAPLCALWPSGARSGVFCTEPTSTGRCEQHSALFLP